MQKATNNQNNAYKNIINGIDIFVINQEKIPTKETKEDIEMKRMMKQLGLGEDKRYKTLLDSSENPIFIDIDRSYKHSDFVEKFSMNGFKRVKESEHSFKYEGENGKMEGVYKLFEFKNDAGKVIHGINVEGVKDGFYKENKYEGLNKFLAFNDAIQKNHLQEGGFKEHIYIALRVFHARLPLPLLMQ